MVLKYLWIYFINRKTILAEIKITCSLGYAPEGTWFIHFHIAILSKHSFTGKIQVGYFLRVIHLFESNNY